MPPKRAAQGCAIFIGLVVLAVAKSGFKFTDLNGDGTWQQGSEPPLSGWTIHLYDENQTTLLGTDVTDGNGFYEFTNRAPDDYVVCEVPQATWTQTAPAAGPGVVTCTNEGTLGYSFVVPAGEHEENNNFGNHQETPPPPGKITIINDSAPKSTTAYSFTASGGLSPSVFVLDDDGDNTNTDSNRQAFTDVATGLYVITETPASGFTLTAINCTGGQTANSLPNHLVTIGVASGDDVVCTFVNTGVEVAGITTTQAVAFTGSETGRAVLSATAALLVGAFLVLVTRRRKRATEV